MLLKKCYLFYIASIEMIYTWSYFDILFHENVFNFGNNL